MTTLYQFNLKNNLYYIYRSTCPRNLQAKYLVTDFYIVEEIHADNQGWCTNGYTVPMFWTCQRSSYFSYHDEINPSSNRLCSLDRQSQFTSNIKRNTSFPWEKCKRQIQPFWQVLWPEQPVSDGELDWNSLLCIQHSPFGRGQSQFQGIFRSSLENTAFHISYKIKSICISLFQIQTSPMTSTSFLRQAFPKAEMPGFRTLVPSSIQEETVYFQSFSL